jgi:cytochrome c peroxidase
MTQRVFYIIPVILYFLLTGCKKANDAVSNELVGQPVLFPKPAGFPEPGLFVNEPLTKEGILLGKKLFYDGRLSKDGSVSCASCHQQVAGFGTYDHDLSHGIYNQHSIRNAPPLFNLAWYISFGWDGAFNSIEEIADAHILSAVDMAGNYSDIANRLKSDPAYAEMFTSAFGTSEVNKDRILKALQQFTGSIISATTKYDSVRQNLASFNSVEQAGYDLFKRHCNSCHTEPLFTDFSFRNNGLPPSLLYDKGRQGVTGLSSDSYKFRVPTLRNLFISFPFMHDGRLIGFNQIYDHYQEVTQQENSGIDDLLRTPIQFTQTERVALTGFLRCLTDFSLSENAEYAP